MKGWLDNFGKAENANDSKVSLSEGFVGMGNDTTGRHYSPAWKGQFEDGGIVPIAQRGKKVDKILNQNKHIDWVQGLYDKDYGSIQIPGQEGRSTHFMESADNRVYPTVRKVDGELQYLGDDAYDYADSTKSYIEFPTDKKAQKFAKNYKRGTGVLDFQQGGSIPGSVGFTYARTAGSAPSEGKYAKKTMPSAQNGQEMKFYQEGLDWKPKSMQNGDTIERVSTSDPRYPELYKNRQVGSWSPQSNAYNLPDLPKVTVTGKDERVQEAMSQGNQRFAQAVLGVIGSSQTVPMEWLTGEQQTPSDEWGFQNIPSINYSQAYIPYSSNPFNNLQGSTASVPSSVEDWKNVGKNVGNFTMDNILDLKNILGTGIVDDLARGAIRNTGQDIISKTFKQGVTPYDYSPEHLINIPKNLIRGIQGKSKVLPSRVQEAIQKNSNLQNTIEETLNNREDAWSVYLGLPPESKGLNLVSGDEATGLSKYELTNPRKINPSNIKEYQDALEWAKAPNQQQLKHLDIEKPGSKVVDSDRIFGVMGGYSKFVSDDGKNIMYRDVWDLQPFKKYLNSPSVPDFIKNFEVSSVIPGAKPFVSEGKLADIKTKYTQAKPYKDIKTRFNEHLDYAHSQYEPDAFVKDLDNPTPEEIFNYDQMIRDNAKKSLLYEIKNNKTFLNSVNYNNSKKYADFSPYIKIDKSKKKKQGGIIKDDNGYLNPENFGKVVEINSNNITMEGVNEALLGVSDTGDTKLMKPGKNYKFKGKKVTEYPIGKNGINQLDAQPKKKLDDLLNFTNYNKPVSSGWLDKFN